ncbi:MAG: LruC domain-containing protein, partial [Leptospiraceae bacterium]|nr:LruC domain-containing protein [Leptospiraceae bacterium]
VAFEDLYPQQGDADFNDYVVRVQNEEDLNSSGKIKRIRGTYEHIAKGAGYNHTLNLKLPEGVTGTYSLKRYNANGTIDIETSGAITSSIELLPDSNTTLSGWNSKATDTFVNGKKVAIELIFDSPMDRTTLGNAPYDLYLKVISTNKEIHFAGLYKDSNGDEIYLDSNGFPWAIAIPGTWKHPYERTDIRTSYSLFRPWYESRGNLHGNWYQTPNTQFVFPTPN